MTLDQRKEKVLALPHGQEIWDGIQTLEDVNQSISTVGVRFDDHPLHDEIVQAFVFLLRRKS